MSIKLRVLGGCFHREHSPYAYAEIDKYLDHVPPSDRDFSFEEHESGPEILVYLAVTTAGLTLAKSVVDLVAAIIKARSDGKKHGDRADTQVELIVRRSDDANGIKEEKVLRINGGDGVDRAAIERGIADAAVRLLANQMPPATEPPAKTPGKRKSPTKKRKK